MSDAEVICTFCEPRPEGEPTAHLMKTLKFWRVVFASSPTRWTTMPLTLDRLHEVEARLTDEQKDRYSFALSLEVRSINGPSAFYRSELFPCFHADAEQKIKALAQVIRGSHAD